MAQKPKKRHLCRDNACIVRHKSPELYFKNIPKLTLEQRYHECVSEKNTTLIRFNIIQDLRYLYDAVSDESIKEKALILIDLEEDDKYRKKYAKVWK